MELTSKEAVSTLPADGDKTSGESVDDSVQTDNAAPRIGRGLSEDLIHEAIEILKQTQRNEKYQVHQDEPFFYEILEGRDVTKRVAYAWTECKENIQRASNCVKRPVGKEGSDCLKNFCAFRIKAIPDKLVRQGITSLIAARGLRVPTRDGPSKPSTIVLIALEQWDERNGFFQELDVGEDICLDGDEKVDFPGTGGALGILISLSL